jgi:hypothetical protein
MFRSILILLCPATLVAQPAKPLGEQVALFAEAHMDAKVGRGECWDLAMEALNAAGARWDGLYGFGDPVEVEAVQRGDIVQFEHVVMVHRDAQRVSKDSFGTHTAIVLEVLAPGHFLLAHQNFGEAGRKVSRYTLIMGALTHGSITFFRPVG